MRELAGDRPDLLVLANRVRRLQRAGGQGPLLRGRARSRQAVGRHRPVDPRQRVGRAGDDGDSTDARAVDERRDLEADGEGCAVRLRQQQLAVAEEADAELHVVRTRDLRGELLHHPRGDIRLGDVVLDLVVVEEE